MAHRLLMDLKPKRRRLAPWLLCAAAALMIAGCASTPPQSSQTRTSAAVPPPATAAEPGADPAQLRGMQAATLKMLLGEPGLVRDEPPAQVWLYAAGSCVFHVFLYDHPGEGYRVSHYDMVAIGPVIHPVKDCFANVLSRAEHRARES